MSGIISHYDSPSDTSGPDRLPDTMRRVISQRLLIQGFLNFDYTGKLYDEFQSEVSKGITDGLIKYREDIVDGLENAPKALLGMLEGKNFGKLIILIGKPAKPE